MPAELQLRGITKRFPGVLANDHIDLDVESGEVHALMGENGAGKSTLMSILYGVLQPDSGEIIIRGERRRFSSPIDAIGAGLGMVFQSFKLFPSLTVAENVVYRAEPTRRGLLDRKGAQRAVAEIADRYGLGVDPAARVDSLPVGVLQRVEIVKALYRDARLLILDEPTAVLTPQERDRLFEVLRRLAADGRTIIFITHKIKEVMTVSDRVAVLRDGRVVASLVTAQTSAGEITRAMTGREVSAATRPSRTEPGEPVLRCESVHVRRGGRTVVDGVSLTVRAGEIVGIAGVAGNGQTELVEAITGLRRVDGGSVSVCGTDVTTASVQARRAAGMAYIPEDRHEVGTASAADARANLLMGYQRQPQFRRRLLKAAAITAHARRLIADYRIKVPGPNTVVGTLSGGNLQKIIVAREISHEAPLLVAEQPTRGVDIGAIEFIHGRLADERDRGGAVLLVSAELSEIFALADRILVMYEGRVTAELPVAEATEASLGLLMAGHQPEGSENEGMAHSER